MCLTEGDKTHKATSEENGEEDICAPCPRGEHGWDEEGNGEVVDPVAGSSNRSATCSDGQRKNLRHECLYRFVWLEKMKREVGGSELGKTD